MTGEGVLLLVLSSRDIRWMLLIILSYMGQLATKQNYSVQIVNNAKVKKQDYLECMKLFTKKLLKYLKAKTTVLLLLPWVYQTPATSSLVRCGLQFSTPVLSTTCGPRNCLLGEKFVSWTNALNSIWVNILGLKDTRQWNGICLSCETWRPGGCEEE